MKAVFLSIFIFLISFANAQKCKTETDPFTNEKTTVFRYSKQKGMWPTRNLFYKLKNDSCKIQFNISFIGQVRVVIPQGSEVLIKLENGEILKFKTQTNASPNVFYFHQQVYTDYLYDIPVTMADVKKISESKVKVLRFFNPQKDATSDTEEYSEVFTKGAECITGKK